MGVRKALHFKAHDEAPPADPHRPHEFRAAGENWIGGGVVPGSAGYRDAGAILTAVGMQFADRHCVICRHEASDPIHAAAEAEE
jgi:hypothetical protein